MLRKHDIKVFALPDNRSFVFLGELITNVPELFDFATKGQQLRRTHIQFDVIVTHITSHRYNLFDVWSDCHMNLGANR